MSTSTANPRPQPSPLASISPILLLVGMLFLTIRKFGGDALGGGSQISLLTATAFCILLGMWRYRRSWAEIEKNMIGNIANTGVALVILLVIGALSGIWMVSGVVPTLICYGMHLIHPAFFLLGACVICALVSVMTGSSWTTIATLGIALMGIGRAQGFAEGWIAGAIISGAYFGDKISPLSDTTVMASSVSGTPLFTHIRYMLFTTVPSLIIALTVFAIAGFQYDVSSTAEMAAVSDALRERFNITPWLLLVPLITGVLIAKRVPGLVTLTASTLLAAIFGLIFQCDALREVGSGDLFKGTMTAVSMSTALPTDNALLSDLISTGGMAGMLNTIWLILCAMCFGGAMQACGMLESITRLFVRCVRGRTSLVASTATSGIFLNFATSDQYLSIILTSSMFGDVYRQNGYETRLLSRTTEDAVTVTSVLIPWNSCGMTQSTVLGVPTLTYLPYCVFNYVSPFMSVLMAAIGYKIYRRVNP